MTTLTTPTVAEISDNITNQVASAISQSIPFLPKNFTRVLAKAVAGVVILVYKYAGFSLLQWFVSTASSKDTVVNGKVLNPLTEWGRLFGVGDPKDGERWEGTATVTVLNQSGTLDAGSQLLRSQTGVIYLTLSGVPLDAATKTITIRATSDQEGNGGVGTLGNLNPGDTLSFVNPQPNVAQDVTIDTETVTGADPEDPEVYRQRIIDRAATEPQGGAYADYRLWGETVDGILNVYPYTGQPGEVDVYSEATEASSGSSDGFPTSAQLQAVKDAIELDVSGLANNRPANALVNSLSIERTGFNVTVTGLVADDAAAAQTTIQTSVDDYLRSREPFILGLSLAPRVDLVSQAGVAGVVEDAASAEGATVTRVEVFLNITPISAYVLGNGEKAKLNSIAFV